MRGPHPFPSPPRVRLGGGFAVAGDLEDVEGTYAAWFDELATDTVIVRPDFYVYDAVPVDAVDQSLARLRTQLSATSAAPVTQVG